ncbi:MAG: GNAT family N-acetyltransferase [Pseudomonadota bacterium]
MAHVATVDDKVVGLRGFATETTAFLWQIGVAPHAQRQGLGMSLLSRFVGEAKALGCCYVMTSISATNAPSNALFERFCKSNAHDMAAVGETGTLGGAMENEVLFSITL